MAGKNIKGITIEIDGDVTKLDRALSGVDKQLSATQRNLREVDRLLKLDPKNVELVDQKQRLLSQAVEATTKRYDTLKRALEESTASNVRFDEWTRKQEKFQGAISATEKELQGLRREQAQLEGLNFAPDSAQMQELAQKISDAEGRLESIRAVAAQTYEELGRPISIEQFDALQRELAGAGIEMKNAQEASTTFAASINELGEIETDTGGKTSKLGELLGEAGLSPKALTAAAAVGAAGAAIKAFAEFSADAIKSAAAYADNILTLSTNFGISVERLQEYQYMAELTDTSLDTITGSITKLTKSMDQARDGTGDAADAFAKLNIRVTENGGQLRDADTVFQEVIKSLSYIKDGTERDAITMAIFGKSALELNSLIAAGADGIAQYAQESHNLNYVLSEEQVKTLGAVDDQFQRVDKAIEAAKNRIAIEFAPQLIELGDKLLEIFSKTDWAEIGRGIGALLQIVTPLVIGLAMAITGLAEALEALMNAASGLFGGNGVDVSRSGRLRGGRGVPGFADGAVVAPNNPMLAIVGDNRTEREVIAPESMIRDAVRAELQSAGGLGGGDLTIVARYESSDNALVRALSPKLEAYWQQRGAVT